MKWYYKCEKYGIEGLAPKTGIKKGVNKGRCEKSKTREEELERENLKLRIEIERKKVIM